MPTHAKMPRQRLAPGEWGKITVKESGGKYVATTYVRDADGRRRQVERSGKSEEDARRNLQRHLRIRDTPVVGQAITSTSTLAELFEAWIAAKKAEGLKQQSIDTYTRVWGRHGKQQIGELRIKELGTGQADRHIDGVGATTPGQAKTLRVVLVGMYGMAVRFGVLAVNPIREVRQPKKTKVPTRSMTPGEFTLVRAAVKAYNARGGHGPAPGRLLPAFIEVLAATGCRPNEVLAVRWDEVDLLGKPPTITISGTLVDHGQIAGKPVHRQDDRKGGAPAHTVILPKFGVEALTALVSESGMDGLVFLNRDGGLMSLANLRRALRAALPEELQWITPRSFRRTVATVVRDELGVEQAQQQLSHSKLATTEEHYVERVTMGPDARKALDRFARGKVRDRK